MSGKRPKDVDQKVVVVKNYKLKKKYIKCGKCAAWAKPLCRCPEGICQACSWRNRHCKCGGTDRCGPCRWYESVGQFVCRCGKPHSCSVCNWAANFCKCAVTKTPPGKKKKKSKKRKLAATDQQPLEVGAPQNAPPTVTLDNPDIFAKITEELFILCDSKITPDFLLLRGVNVAWKKVVDHHLRTVGKELTIKVAFSDPDCCPPKRFYWEDDNITTSEDEDESEDEEDESEDEEDEFEDEEDDEKDQLNEADRTRKLIYVTDFAAKLSRQSEKSIVAQDVFEPKGLLIQVPFEKLQAFIDFIKSLNDVDSDGNLLTMSQTTLQLAFIDKYKHSRGVQFEYEIDKAFTPMTELEKLFPKLEHLSLTVDMNAKDLFCFRQILESIALHRAGGALKSLEVNCLEYFKDYQKSPLEALAPQLEHLALNYQERRLVSLSSTAEKLRSLKLLLTDQTQLTSTEASIQCRAAVFSRITTLEIAYHSTIVGELKKILPHCTAVASLKLHSNANSYFSPFGSGFFQCLRPTNGTLRELTLINFDLAKILGAHCVLPELTTLTLLSIKGSILEAFRLKRSKIFRNTVYQVDVPLVVRVLAAQFPKLQSLSMTGLVFGCGTVKRQLAKGLTKRLPGITFQLNFGRYYRP